MTVRACSVLTDPLWPHGLWPTRLVCPWNFPGKNTGVCCHFPLQGIFPTQALNACVGRHILYCCTTWESRRGTNFEKHIRPVLERFLQCSRMAHVSGCRETPLQDFHLFLQGHALANSLGKELWFTAGAANKFGSWVAFTQPLILRLWNKGIELDYYFFFGCIAQPLQPAGSWFPDQRLNPAAYSGSSES